MTKQSQNKSSSLIAHCRRSLGTWVDLVGCPYQSATVVDAVTVVDSDTARAIKDLPANETLGF